MLKCLLRSRCGCVLTHCQVGWLQLVGQTGEDTLTQLNEPNVTPKDIGRAGNGLVRANCITVP